MSKRGWLLTVFPVFPKRAELILARRGWTSVQLEKGSLYVAEAATVDVERQRYSPEELKEILRLHEMWLIGEEGGKRATLFHADLNGVNLSGANLYNAYLRGTSFNEANLRHVIMEQAYLSHASFHKADLTAARMSRANLRGTVFSNANLSGANLSGSDLRSSILSYARLHGSQFYGCHLLDADLTFADFENAHLNGADLTCADLNGSNVTPFQLSFAIRHAKHPIRHQFEVFYREAAEKLEELLQSHHAKRESIVRHLRHFWAFAIYENQYKACQALRLLEDKLLVYHLERLEVILGFQKNSTCGLFIRHKDSDSGTAKLNKAGKALQSWIESQPHFVGELETDLLPLPTAVRMSGEY